MVLGSVPVAPLPAAPQALCSFTDERLAEASGLVAGPDGPVVVNDSGNPSTLYRLDDDCEVVATTAVEPAGVDVEDLAQADDGTWWIADIGDNRRVRSTVAMLRLRPDGERADVELVYTDGPRDAEALLLGSDARPVIVTKDLGGRSGVYTTDDPLPAGPVEDPVTLRRVAEVAIPPTVTRGGGAVALAAFGGGLITGGAVSPDGAVAALRTYTDAWLYPLAPGPVTAETLVAALGERPVQVPLPDEPQGEAVAFTPDGTLLSASESPEESAPWAPPRGQLRAVPGAVGLAGELTADRPAPAAGSPAPAAPEQGAQDGGGATVRWGAAVAVALVAVGGLLALRRRRGG